MRSGSQRMAAKLGLMPIVELQQVRKVYDTKVAVDDLSFTIEPGTMFGLLGPTARGRHPAFG